MKKYALQTLSVLWLLGISFSFAQKEKTIDSLVKITTEQIGIEKIDALNELAWEFRKKLDSTGVNYALEALQLSEQQNYDKGISDAYNRLGGIAKKKGSLSDAKGYYLKALAVDTAQNYLYAWFYPR